MSDLVFTTFSRNSSLKLWGNVVSIGNQHVLRTAGAVGTYGAVGTASTESASAKNIACLDHSTVQEMLAQMEEFVEI